LETKAKIRIICNKKLRANKVHGKSCYQSVENISSSSVLSVNIDSKVNKSIALPAAQYGCGTWPVTLREEHNLRAFEKKKY
jgi:hypothetical protein